jgi:puromycin-sensitive aminopeptidase
MKDKELVKKVMKYTLTEDVKSQDSAEFLISVGITKNGRELAWEFFKENRKLFQERFPVTLQCFNHGNSDSKSSAVLLF